MNAIGTYAFINAKVRAMRSELMDAHSYRLLLTAKSYRDLLVQLASLGYGEMVDEIGYHQPVSLEKALVREEIKRIGHIEKFCPGDLKNFTRLLLERYEAERLKAILRLWFHEGGGSESISRDTIVFPLPIDGLLAAKELDDIISLLAETSFAEPLSESADAFQKGQSVFPLELALDRNEVQRLIKYIQKANRTDKRIIRRLMGVEIDLRNLSWIGRFKAYYGMSSADIVENLLPWGYRLNTARLHQLIADGKYLSVLQDISPDIRKLLPENVEERIALDTLETFMVGALLQEAKRAFSEFPFSVGALLGYFYLVRIESRNIRFLIEAKLYEIPAEEAEAHLVF